MKNEVRDPVRKAMQLLRYAIEESEGSIGVRSTAAALKISPSSAHRLLNALVREDLLEQDAASGGYGLNVEIVRLANLVLGRFPLHQLATVHLRDLVNQCNETALLGIYDRNRREMMFAAIVESRHKLRYVSELRQWMPVYAGASGLGIMAFLPRVEQQTIIAQSNLTAMTDNTITEPYRLEQELALVRKRGYARTISQRTQGAAAIAAPIFGRDGCVLGDVVVTLPELRFDPANESSIAHLVMSCARTITKKIGGHYRDPDAVSEESAA